MTDDHLTEADRVLCEALESCASEFEYDVAASHLAAQRIRELSRLHAAEADAARLAEAGTAAMRLGVQTPEQLTAWIDALTAHSVRLIDG
ncbi:MAG: hypothetical protein E6Q97_05525 [Desulfurellales bacterium]|nr:MAG: hypothetical protein E6Q97_05525 [Desulfurellales bacterium]